MEKFEIGNLGLDVINQRDRKRIAQIRYLANKFNHPEIAPGVFRGKYITYHYNIQHKMLVIKRNKDRFLSNSYIKFENEIGLRDCNPMKPKRIN